MEGTQPEMDNANGQLPRVRGRAPLLRDPVEMGERKSQRVYRSRMAGGHGRTGEHTAEQLRCISL